MERRDNVAVDNGFFIDDPRDIEEKYNMVSEFPELAKLKLPGAKKTTKVKIPKSILKDKQLKKLPYLTKKSIAKERANKLGIDVNWRNSTIESIELDIRNKLIELAKKRQQPVAIKPKEKKPKSNKLHASTVKSIVYQKAKSLGLQVKWTHSIQSMEDKINQLDGINMEEEFNFLDPSQLEEEDEYEYDGINMEEEFNPLEPSKLAFRYETEEFPGSFLILETIVLVKLGGRIHYDDLPIDALRHNMPEKDVSSIYEFYSALIHEFLEESLIISSGFEYKTKGYSDPGSYIYNTLRNTNLYKKELERVAYAGGERDADRVLKGGIRLNINIKKLFLSLSINQLNELYNRKYPVTGLADIIYDFIGFIYVIEDELLYVNRIPGIKDEDLFMPGVQSQIQRALYTESNIEDPWFVIGVEAQEIVTLDPQYWRDSEFGELMFGYVSPAFMNPEERRKLAAQLMERDGQISFDEFCKQNNINTDEEKNKRWDEYDRTVLRKRNIDTPIQANPDLCVEDGDLMRNDCVYVTICEIVKTRQERREIGKYIDVLAELKMEHKDSGCSLEQLANFCEKFKINIGICNDIGEVLIDKRYNKKEGIFGQKSKLAGFSKSKVSHFYRITDVDAIKKRFKNQLECNVINDVSKIQTLKCKECEEVFENTTTMAKHKLTHEKRTINDIDDFNTSLVEYIVKNNRYPILNQSLTSFADRGNIYQLPNDSVSLDGKTWYSSYGMYGIDLINKMYPNIQSQYAKNNKILFENHCTAWVETFVIDDETITNKKEELYYAYDVTRCYTAILSMADLPIISSIDCIKPFSGCFEKGSFYLCPLVDGNDIIITDKKNKVKNVFYPCELASFFVTSGIFTESSVISEINPSKVVNLSSFVESIYNLKVDDSVKKEIINKTTGCLAIDKVKNLGVPQYIESANDLARAVSLAKFSKQHLEVKSLRYHGKNIGERLDDKLRTSYVIRLDDAAPSINGYKPMYNYIIGYGQYVMRRAKREGSLQNAICLSIKTDEIMFDKPVNLTTAFEGCSFGSFKSAEMKPVKAREYSNKYGIEYTVVKEKSAYKSIKALKPAQSCIITGMPGCGKSYMWRQFRDALIESGEVLHEEIAESSFQNNVIRNISDTAKTLHTLLSMESETGKTRLRLFKRFNKYKYIYIDECQMMPAGAISILVWLKQNMKQLTFVLSGDFDQWLSIGCEYQMNNSNIIYLTGGNHLRLHGNQRISDKLYLKALKTSMDAAYEYLKKNITKPKYYITYYSNESITNNYIELNYHIYNCTYGTSILTNELFELRHMLPVICTMNCHKLNLIKGCHYTVISIGPIVTLTLSDDFYDPECVENGCDVKCYEISYKKFYQYFELGFAFTCHKTIGLTIKEPYCILTNAYEHKKRDVFRPFEGKVVVAEKRKVCPYGGGKVTGHTASLYGYVKAVNNVENTSDKKQIVPNSVIPGVKNNRADIDVDDVRTRYAYVALTRCNDPANVTIKDSLDCKDVTADKRIHTCQYMPLAHFYEEPVEIVEEKRVIRKKSELDAARKKELNK